MKTDYSLSPCPNSVIFQSSYCHLTYFFYTHTIFFKICMYMVAPGLRCSTQDIQHLLLDLSCSTWENRILTHRRMKTDPCLTLLRKIHLKWIED